GCDRRRGRLCGCCGGGSGRRGRRRRCCGDGGGGGRRGWRRGRCGDGRGRGGRLCGCCGDGGGRCRCRRRACARQDEVVTLGSSAVAGLVCPSVAYVCPVQGGARRGRDEHAFAALHDRAASPI